MTAISNPTSAANPSLSDLRQDYENCFKLVNQLHDKWEEMTKHNCAIYFRNPFTGAMNPKASQPKYTEADFKAFNEENARAKKAYEDALAKYRKAGGNF